MEAEPFVKWVGGKRSVLDAILPAAPEKFGAYFEPFVGGGAVFFALAERARGGAISDINEELLTTYRVVRDKPDELLKKLKEHEKKHYAWLKKEKAKTNKKLRALGLAPKDYETLKRKKGDALKKTLEKLNKKRGTSVTSREWEEVFPPGRISKEEKNKIYYYKVREEAPTSDVAVAARFIYLNRTCFNGLYRVNAKGKFNVPIGDYDAPDITREKTIKKASKALKKIDSIKNEDFSSINPKKGDFVYLDPPYDIINPDTFTQYTEGDFTRFDQARLRDFLDSLDKKGVLWMASNHDTPFIRRLYRNYNIYQIEVGRSINSKGSARGAVKEVIITNYKPPVEPVLNNGAVSLISKKDLKEASQALKKEKKNVSDKKLLRLIEQELPD